MSLRRIFQARKSAHSFGVIQKWKLNSIKKKVLFYYDVGSLQVFFDGKKQSGCYVKVYSNGSKGKKFYRDGYTDITGNFKYALNDL